MSDFESTNIVKPSTVSLNLLSLSKDGTNFNSEFFNKDLDTFSNVGFMTVVNRSCTNMINKDIRIMLSVNFVGKNRATGHITFLVVRDQILLK